MEPSMVQPDARPLTDPLVHSLVAAVSPDGDPLTPVAVEFRGEHSNDVTEIRLRDGRCLMVKRGRYDWTAERFRASRLAAQLLRRSGRVLAPQPLDLPVDLDSRPLEAYWRLELPTLDEVWPELDGPSRLEALRSWGRLIRQVHDIRLRGHGYLASRSREESNLSDFLTQDLRERLLPALHGEWPEGARIAEELLRWIPEAERRVPTREGVLLHGDLHMGNVLCRAQGGGSECVGLLDLETALVGPPEVDLAKIEVLHAPLFMHPLTRDELERLYAGYGARLDPFLLALFRTYHLLNLGFHDAFLGFAERAEEVAGAARGALMALRGVCAATPPVAQA